MLTYARGSLRSFDPIGLMGPDPRQCRKKLKKPHAVHDIFADDVKRRWRGQQGRRTDCLRARTIH